MSETLTAAATTAAAEQVVKIPANLMGLIRESYDTRERALDWMLAIAVSLTMAYVFRAQLGSFMGIKDISVNAGRAADIVPSKLNNTVSGFYGTYNMPMSRKLPYRPGPNSVRVPYNPNQGPYFSAEDNALVNQLNSGP